MSWWSRQPSADVTFEDLSDDHPFWYSPAGAFSSSFSGFGLGPEQAMRIGAVFACVSILAETLASLPCILYRRLPNGGKERARDHRLYRTLRQQPNGWQNRIDFFSSGQTNVGLRGRMYAEIRDDGRRVELLPLAVDRVEVEQLASGRLRYQYHPPKGERRTLLQEEVLHVRDLSLDGFEGMSRAALAREAIGVSAAAEAFVGGFFKNDATGRLVFEHPGNLTPEKRKEFEEYIQANWSGWQNRAKPAITWGGLTTKEIGLRGEGDFIVDPRKFQVTDVARFWRVPSFMLNAEEKNTAWGTGIDELKRGFLTFTMRPWADRWSEALTQALLDEEEQEEFSIEFFFEDLLRGEFKARQDGLEIQRRNGVISPNEWRVIERMNPRSDPAGDEYQDTPPGAAANRSREQAATVPVPLRADAAMRIANKEVRDVTQRAARADDDLGKWVTWLRSYYEKKQSLYVLTVLAPLGEAYEVDANAVAQRIAETAQAALMTGVPDGWAEQRTDIVRAILDAAFKCDDAAELAA